MRRKRWLKQKKERSALYFSTTPPKYTYGTAPTKTHSSRNKKNSLGHTKQQERKEGPAAPAEKNETVDRSNAYTRSPKIRAKGHHSIVRAILRTLRRTSCCIGHDTAS